jgi:hypothetical protein
MPVKLVVVALMSLTLAAPSFAKTHKDTYPVPCSELWAAVKDIIRNSGNYSIISTDNTEMTASYSISGALRKRTNSVVLNSRGASCEMQIQSNYSGFAHDDAGDFKKRVEESLAKLKGSSPSEPAKPADAKK